MASIYPNSLEDVVNLIHRLYQPGPPEQITQIQDVLQSVQRSPEGWQLADQLLERPDDHVQFFGALTFTVKLNNDWNSLPETEVPNLLNRLLGWLVRLVCGGAGNLVIRKLSSTLVTFFLRFPEAFSQPLRLLLCALYAGRPGTLEEFLSLSDTGALLREMPDDRKLAALTFCSMLVEEVGKVDAKNIKNVRFHQIVQDNTPDAVSLIKNAIDPAEGANKSGSSQVVESGLKTFQSWVYYSLRSAINADTQFPQLKVLTRLVIDWMLNEEHYETACDVVTDILTQSFAFLNHDDRFYLANLLTSPWAVERYNSLQTGENDWEEIQFSRLLVAFAEATVQQLAETLDSPTGSALIQMLHGLLAVPGYPRVEDEISPTTFEFWGSFADHLLDSLSQAGPDDNMQWIERGKQEIQRAVDGYWRKIRIPPQSIATTWNKDQKDGFMGFRRDVADFVDSAYSLLGSQVFARLVDQVIVSLDGRPPQEVRWLEIESSLFCLKALSDNIGDEPHQDECLERLFGSRLFGLLVECADAIPSKVRTTCVSIIGSYATFFERKTNYLPAVLTFLFISLSTPGLAVPASRSISLLCDSCRSSLTAELPAFLHQYNLFVQQPNSDHSAKERVLTAICCVIQALPSEQAKLEPITTLLTLIQSTAQHSLSLLSTDPAAAQETALQTLTYLTFMGKGLQAPDDLPIDLTAPNPALAPNFYSQPPNQELQQTILKIITALTTAFPSSGELVDSVCGIFRTGFAETQPGLFCFPPDTIVTFFITHAWRTETILSACGCFTSSHSNAGSLDVTPQIRTLLDFTHNLITRLEGPQQEPEIAQGFVEFLSKLFRRYIGVLVTHPRVHDFFVFTLACLTVRESLAKKTACQFWSGFLTAQPDDPDTRVKLEGIIEGCGERLCQQLVWAVGGGCQRSEVEAFAEVLKKVVVRHRLVKGWLLSAVEAVGEGRVESSEKRMWVEKVMNLRGKRQTTQVCKEFWLRCRGSEFDYAS